MTSATKKHIETTQSFPTFSDLNLYFYEGNTWEKIPLWFRFFLELGASVTKYRNNDQKFILALAIPTRSYASLLIASGINYGRSFIPQEKTDQQYKEYICSLDQNTPVIYRNGSKKYKALIDHCHPEMYLGKKIIGLKIEKGTSIFVDIDEARQISIDIRDSILLPSSQKGRNLNPPSPFIETIFSKNAHEFILESRLESLLFGHIKILKEEASLSLSLHEEGTNYHPGHLQDLIRPYSEHPQGLAYRSLLWSTTARTKPKLPEKSAPFVVFFDGAQAYFNWKDSYVCENQIIILDKTERNFRFAVDQINNNEFVNRSEKSIKMNIPTIPSGIEMMVFGVNR